MPGHQKNIRILFVSLCLLAGASTTVYAQGQQSQSVGLLLSAYHKKRFKQSSDDPLRLTLTIFNRSARNSHLANIRKTQALKAYEKSGMTRRMGDSQKKALQKRLRRSPVRSLTLGSEARPVAGDICFSVQNQEGAPVAVKVERLRSSKAPVQISLDERTSLAIEYGISADAISKLRPGFYKIEAQIGQGGVVSNCVDIQLVDEACLTRDEKVERLFLSGYFYVLDNQLDKAERIARQLAKEASRRDLRLRLLAEISIKKRNWKAARQSISEAIRLHRKTFDERHDPKPEAYEPPRHLLLRQLLITKEQAGQSVWKNLYRKPTK